jgi:NAD(P)-dependent dehydrogenase (short-subunit alcohol dehydrogenase family)
MELSGKVALVTGAGSGIGAVAALRLAREGARVGALGHTEDELRATVGRSRAAGSDGTIVFVYQRLRHRQWQPQA